MVNLNQPPMLEYWKDYQGGYRVSCTGRVLGKYGHELRPARGRKGYLMVGLSLNGKTRTQSIARMVGLLFCENDMPLLYNQINHINGCNTMNYACNLEWCDCARNIQEKYDLRRRHGLPLLTPKEIEGHKRAAEKTGTQVLYNGILYKTINALCKAFGVSKKVVRRGLRRGKWRGLPICLANGEKYTPKPMSARAQLYHAKAISKYGKRIVLTKGAETKKFRSIKEASIFLGIESMNLRVAIRQRQHTIHGWTIAEVDGKSVIHEVKTHGKRVVWRGQTYTINELAELCNTSRAKVLTALKHGLWRNNPIAYEGHEPNKFERKVRVQGNPIIYKGVRYPSATALAKVCNCTPRNILKALHKGYYLAYPLVREGEDPNLVEVKTRDSYSKKVEYLGRVFNSIAALAKHYKVGYKTVQEVVKRGKWHGEPICLVS